MMGVHSSNDGNRGPKATAAGLGQPCGDLPALTRCEIGSYTALACWRAS